MNVVPLELIGMVLHVFKDFKQINVKYIQHVMELNANQNKMDLYVINVMILLIFMIKNIVVLRNFIGMQILLFVWNIMNKTLEVIIILHWIIVGILQMTLNALRAEVIIFLIDWVNIKMLVVNKIDLYLLIKMGKKNVHKVYKFLRDVKCMMKVY